MKLKIKYLFYLMIVVVFQSCNLKHELEVQTIQRPATENTIEPGGWEVDDKGEIIGT